MRNAYIRRHRWEDNIRIDLRKIGWEVVCLLHMTEGKDQWWDFVNAVLNHRIP